MFDGNGYTISGLWSSSNWGISYKGLFSVITDGAVVENLNIELDNRSITGGYEVGGVTGVAKNGATIRSCNVSNGKIVVTGGGYAGSIVGFTYGTPSVTIEDCTVTNVTTQTSGNYSGGIVGVAGSGTKIVDSNAIDTTSIGNSYVGGIAGGINGKSSIENCYTDGYVEARTSYAGGLVGVVYEGSSIIGGYAEGDVKSSYYGGGLVGAIYDYSTIDQSYATGNVTVKNYIAGGLVGEAVASTISNSYARGDVAGTTGVGGFVGYFSGDGVSKNKSVENSYSTGKVTGIGTTEYGAFNGRSGVEYKGTNFYNAETAGVAQGYGTAGNPQGDIGINTNISMTSQSSISVQNSTTTFPQGKTTQEMMYKETYANWDFNDIWEINEGNGYPTFIVEENTIPEMPDIPNVEELPVVITPAITPDLPDPGFDDSTFTRGEWLALLMEKLELYNVDEDSAVPNFFGDTIGTEYGNYVEIGKMMGILPETESEGYIDPYQDIPLFEEDKIATREFVAYTTIKAMGFVGDYEIECSDFSLLQYPNEVAVAVQQGFLNLEINKFNPNDPLTGTDKNRIFIAIDEFNSSEEVEEEYDNTVFLENVIKSELTNITNYDITNNDDGTITVILPYNEYTTNLENRVFILPPNNSYISGLALKGIYYEEKIQDSVKLICSEPKIQEIVSKIDFAGTGGIDVDGIIVADGVNMTVETPTEVNQRSSVNVGGRFEPDVNLSFKIEEYGTTVSFSLDEINAKLDADIGITSGIRLNEFLFSLKNSEKVEVSLSKSVSKRQVLATVPVVIGTTGLSVDVDVVAIIGIDGTVRTYIKMSQTNGLQIKNGSVRNIKDSSATFTPTEINASAEIGVGADSRLEYIGVWEIVQINNSIVGKLKYNNKLNIIPNCSDLKTETVVKSDLSGDRGIVGTLLDTFLNGSLKLFEMNIPIKDFHVENFRIVKNCALGDGIVEGRVVDAETNIPMKNARISLSSLGNAKNTYTDNDGYFKIEDVSVGRNTLTISATSYMKYTNKIDVVANSTNYVETLMMIDRVTGDGVGNINGNIVNSLTGNTATNVSISIRQNWNNFDGDIIKTGYSEEGTYSLDLLAGYYTLAFEKDDYFTEYVNVAIVGDVQTEEQISLSPMFTDGLDGFRVVLT